MQAKTNKLALAVLALSLTQAVSASEKTHQNDVDNTSTYWGVGIGSVLGAVIAGPPGAAVGATLGGSIGWGKDQHDALDESVSDLEQQELKLQQHTQILENSRHRLKLTEQELLSLKRSHSIKDSRLNDLEAAKNTSSQGAEFLENLVDHYAQEIYFHSGQSDTPEYAQERLASLAELLKQHPDLRVSLKGFTDSRGSAKLNARLAQDRVDGIKAALKDMGIDEARVTSEASIPEAITDIEKLAGKAHVLDRRVSIKLSIEDLNKKSDIGSLAVLEQ